jgi:hypothetical protein
MKTKLVRRIPDLHLLRVPPLVVLNRIDLPLSHPNLHPIDLPPLLYHDLLRSTSKRTKKRTTTSLLISTFPTPTLEFPLILLAPLDNLPVAA